MHCPTCERDSTNRRVCPHCFTPYPTDEAPTAPSRQSTAESQGGWPGQSERPVRAVDYGSGPFGRVATVVMRQTPLVRWSGLGIVLVLLFWAFSDPATAPTAPAGTPVAFDAAPMTPAEAQAIIQRTRETALVEMHGDEVFVSYHAATFPARAEGQVALVRQFTRADEIMTGRRRRIAFYEPSGRVYARADPVHGIELLR
jgi:hypothetical protein